MPAVLRPCVVGELAIVSREVEKAHVRPAEKRLLARQHGRSLNSEIVWALREYIARQKGEHTDADKQKDQA